MDQVYSYFARKDWGRHGGVVGGVTRGANPQTKIFRARFSPLKMHKILNEPFPYSKMGSIYTLEHKKYGGVVKNGGGVTRGANLTYLTY